MSKITMRLLSILLGMVLAVTIAWAQSGGYTPPPRGAPEGRLGGASRDASPGLTMHWAERRIALVIGNGAYQHLPRLDNPANDALLMAATLKSLGFELVGDAAQTDLDRDHFERAVREFGGALSEGAVGLFYYAGHGVQVRGENYLVPVGANPVSARDVDFELIDASLVLKQMDVAGSKLNFVILDACRNNPFGDRGFRDSGGGLAQMRAPSGTLISYATQPGNIARDGTGQNSPYTEALASAMRLPGLGVFEVFNTAAVMVKNQTGGQQQPWVSNSPIEGNFFFASASAAPVGETAPAGEEANRPERRANPDSIASVPSARIAPPPRGPQPEPTATAMAATPLPGPPPHAEAALSLEAKREVQRALHLLGVYQGEADGGFGAGTIAAIKEFQSFEGDPQTGVLTVAEHTALLDREQRLAALLDQPPASPLGVTAASLKGADQRYARAWAYDNGRGVRADLGEAVYWYALAAADGDARALTNLGTLYANGWNGGRPDPASAALLWLAAATRGEAIAMYDLGVLYEKGIGVAADPAKARAWYQRAADRNHPDARAALRRLGG